MVLSCSCSFDSPGRGPVVFGFVDGVLAFPLSEKAKSEVQIGTSTLRVDFSWERRSTEPSWRWLLQKRTSACYEAYFLISMHENGIEIKHKNT